MGPQQFSNDSRAESEADGAPVTTRARGTDICLLSRVESAAGNTSNSPAFVSKRVEVNARALGAVLIHAVMNSHRVNKSHLENLKVSGNELTRNRIVPGTELIYMGTLDHPRVGRPLDIFTSSKD